MNRTLSILASAFLFLTALTASAAGQSVESALNQQFQDKVLVLLHPDARASLRFENGKAVDAAWPLAPWTVYGGVRIRKIHLQSNKLGIEGHRVFFRFNSYQPVPFDLELIKKRGAPPCQPTVKIDIKLDQPIQSADQAQAVLAQVFAFRKEDFLRSVPAYWYAYVVRNIDFDPAKPGEMLFKPQQPKEGDKEALNSALDNNGPEIFHVDKDVKRAKATYVPEPEFSEAARYEKFQGVTVLYVVVDKSGSIAQVKIIRPLGVGLDDQAALKLKEWRFDPGLRNGDPVALAMNVEVAFNLY